VGQGAVGQGAVGQGAVGQWICGRGGGGSGILTAGTMFLQSEAMLEAGWADADDAAGTVTACAGAAVGEAVSIGVSLTSLGESARDAMINLRMSSAVREVIRADCVSRVLPMLSTTHVEIQGCSPEDKSICRMTIWSVR